MAVQVVARSIGLYGGCHREQRATAKLLCGVW